MKQVLISWLAACSVIAAAEPTYHWMVPKAVRGCISTGQRLAREPIQANWEVNPFYISGDFDGDGNADYAVAIKSTMRDAGRGILVCAKSRPIAVLGSVSKLNVLRGESGDEVISLGWSRATRPEVIAELDENNPRQHAAFRRRLLSIKGDLILMPAEDRIGVIFHEAGSYHWYTINAIWMK